MKTKSVLSFKLQSIKLKLGQFRSSASDPGSEVLSTVLSGVDEQLLVTLALANAWNSF